MGLYLTLLALFIVLTALPRDYDKMSTPFMVFLLIIVGIFRDVSVGTDLSGGYDVIFRTTTLDTRTWSSALPVEPGFSYLVGFFKAYIANNYYAFYGVLFPVTFALIFFYFKKMSRRPLMSLALLYLYYFYFSTFNAMRQYLAFALCLPFLTAYIKQRGALRLAAFAAAVTVIAIFLHGSVITLLAYPVLIFLEGRHVSRNHLLAVLFGSLVFYFFRGIALGVLGKVLFFLGPRYQMYINAGLGLLTSAYTKRATVFLAFVFCLAITLLSRERDSSFYAFFVYCIGTIIFVPIVPIVSRIFMMYFILGVPYLANLGWGDRRLRGRGNLLIYRAYIVLYGLFYYTLASMQNFSDAIPYRSWVL